MANLETLELTIQSNAQSAVQGLNSLTRSLSFLSREVGKNISGLVRLNAELEKLGKNGNISITFRNAAKGVKSATKKMPETPSWVETHPLISDAYTGSVVRHLNGAGRYNWYGANLKRWNFKPYGEGAFESVGANPQWYYPVGHAPVSREVQGMDETIRRNTGKLPEIKGKASEALAELKNVGEEAEKTGKKTTGAFGRIAKIAQTMLIRTALRNVMKAFGESWAAAYKFSKAMGGDFANSVDKAKTLLSGATNSLVSTFAPALTALLPVINSIVNAIQYLCKGIQWLLSLLGASSEMFGATTDAINAYAGAAGGGGKANKELLASFDELNVISSESGGGGGGGTGAFKPGLFSDKISEELAAIQLIVSESLLAIGLILAFTGHVGVGVGLIAVGAAGIVQVTTAAFSSKLANEIKQQIASIMSAVGGAELALGLILAFNGHIPLGVALIAAGAANLATAIGISFNIGDGIIGLITDLDIAVGGAMLAIGALLLFTGANIPLGLGALALGAIKMVSALSERFGWDSTIIDIIEGLEAAVSVASLAIGAILLFSGANIPLGLGLMAAGGVSLASEIAPHWDSIVREISQAFIDLGITLVNKWEEIKTSISIAWDTLMQWADATLLEPIRSAWNSVRNFFIMLFGSKEISGSIAWWADKAWNIIATWWDTNISQPFKNAWNSVKSFFVTLFGSKEITGSIAWWANRAWTIIEDWWKTNVYDKISNAWAAITEFFSGVFKPIQDAWEFLEKIINITNITITLTLNTQLDDAMKVLLGFTPSNISEEARGTLFDFVIQQARNMIPGLASGGFPTEGQLFIAREAGAELVGSMNGHTAVANNDQIVEGIASGVRQAEAEQNALLAEQNSLLRALLAKDQSVRPSVSFGRTVQQSLDMYGKVSG